MTPMLKQVLRLVTFSIGLSAASLALAVATVTVTPTGSQINETTTLQLTDSAGKVVEADKDNPNQYSVVTPGEYKAQVLVNGKPVGDPQTITLTDGPKRVSVDAKYGVTVLPPTAGARPTLLGQELGTGRLAAGWGGVDGFGKASIGTNRTTDKPLLSASSTIYTVPWTAGLSSVNQDGVDKSRLVFSGQTGSRTNSTTVDGEYAVTFFQPTLTGITGYAAPGGADVSLHTTYYEYVLFKAFLYKLALDELNRWTIFGQPIISFWYNKTKDDGTITNRTLPSISTTTNQRVKANNLLLGWGPSIQGMYGENMSYGLGAGIGANIYWARYNGMQMNRCFLCSPAAQMYDVSDSDSKNGVSFAAWANAGVGFSLSKDLDLIAGVNYRFTQAPTVQTKAAPSDSPNHIVTTNRNWANIQAGIQYKF